MGEASACDASFPGPRTRPRAVLLGEPEPPAAPWTTTSSVPLPPWHTQPLGEPDPGGRVGQRMRSGVRFAGREGMPALPHPTMMCASAHPASDRLIARLAGAAGKMHRPRKKAAFFFLKASKARHRKPPSRLPSLDLAAAVTLPPPAPHWPPPPAFTEGHCTPTFLI